MSSIREAGSTIKWDASVPEEEKVDHFPQIPKSKIQAEDSQQSTGGSSRRRTSRGSRSKSRKPASLSPVPPLDFKDAIDATLQPTKRKSRRRRGAGRKGRARSRSSSRTSSGRRSSKSQVQSPKSIREAGSTIKWDASVPDEEKINHFPQIPKFKTSRGSRSKPRKPVGLSPVPPLDFDFTDETGRRRSRKKAKGKRLSREPKGAPSGASAEGPGTRIRKGLLQRKSRTVALKRIKECCESDNTGPSAATPRRTKRGLKRAKSGLKRRGRKSQRNPSASTDSDSQPQASGKSKTGKPKASTKTRPKKATKPTTRKRRTGGRGRASLWQENGGETVVVGGVSSLSDSASSSSRSSSRRSSNKRANPPPTKDRPAVKVNEDEAP